MSIKCVELWALFLVESETDDEACDMVLSRSGGCKYFESKDIPPTQVTTRISDLTPAIPKNQSVKIAAPGGTVSINSTDPVSI